jgi:hypothetical protein
LPGLVLFGAEPLTESEDGVDGGLHRQTKRDAAHEDEEDDTREEVSMRRTASSTERLIGVASVYGQPGRRLQLEGRDVA